ncbi:ThuA domain-containing protein [Streptomyces sp. NBC_01198]|uniref:ThuA domain-containing protein n=1 Tax=Streptomyces sp. NBC_01198 TaxID=2903769 RepID=UPI003FA37E03
MAELLAPAHAVEIVTSVADLGTALKSAHVLLVNASANRTKPIPEDGEFGRRLDEFLTRGGGLLAMHSSAIAFPGLPGWRSAVGAAWDHGRTFHPPIGRSLIRRSTAVHPISEGLGDFWVHDERYSDLDLVSGIVPLYFHTDGSRTHPLIWARPTGKGRTVYNALGHDLSSFDSPEHAELLTRCVSWLSRESGSPVGPGDEPGAPAVGPRR